jgi:hypothetical protein
VPFIVDYSPKRKAWQGKEQPMNLAAYFRRDPRFGGTVSLKTGYQ